MIMQVKTFSFNKGNAPLKITILAVFFSFLSACSSAPNALTYYLLHSTSDTSVLHSEAKQIAVLDKVTLPEYLKHRGLVYQTSDTNLHISTSHLWAEPVDEGLTKALTSALGLNNVALVRPDHYASEGALHISLYINDFVSTYEGEVIFSGQYAITRTSEEASIHPFMFKAVLSNDGFASSIKAMRSAIEKLAKDINTTMNPQT
ncbi:membrane integrity-associated transporter subunit PqiC [Alteromonas sp. BL110]|uniref:PqiC family protein n=1 Tax=Alteromonas sp. BL110 TaxID=1714845 RepID=UPI000E4BE1B4|nr:PqiC family protein [Alteromonas sp. BL110]AXT37428.1 membrane integrity-associated transporter subunit PqiC [Alteromonas sp. BL110]RKM80165.1 membrane integrity-associated transporter subunit PqiC [Alteromonas sp. BL110]